MVVEKVELQVGGASHATLPRPLKLPGPSSLKQKEQVRQAAALRIPRAASTSISMMMSREKSTGTCIGLS